MAILEEGPYVVVSVELSPSFLLLAEFITEIHFVNSFLLSLKVLPAGIPFEKMPKLDYEASYLVKAALYPS